MAHTKMFSVSLLYLISYRASISILPLNRVALSVLTISFPGFNFGGSTIGAINLSLPINDFFFVLVPIILAILATCIIATVRVVATGLEFNPFKLLAIILGILFSVAIGGQLLTLTPEIPFAIQSLLVFFLHNHATIQPHH
jgi:hypothetical protein